MNKNLLIYLSFIGLFALLFACKKDETKVVMLASPIVPTIKTMPDLTLTRTNGTKSLVFVGTPLDPGFQASATYYLEACAKGNNFVNAIAILNDVQDLSMSISVSSLNGILLKKFTADQVSAVDFRIRAVMAIDAGTGYTPMVYSSAVNTANVTVYGLPRLDLVGSGITQKIESALGDGKYTGFVKLDATKPFTLKDPDTGTIYGLTGGAFAANGGGITATASGWYKFTADTKGLTYAIDSYMIGLVGSATPNGWNSPDSKMDYDSATGTWKITITLIDGQIKFRLNDGWTWNLGWNPGKTSLIHNGDNVDVTAGNYTIALTLTDVEAGTFTITKN